MELDPPREWPQGYFCPDAITAYALAILEAPFPTRFDMSPTEDPKINLIFDLADDDFKADFDLLWEVPIDLQFLKEGERLAWAEGILARARSENLRKLSPYDLLRAYRA